LGNRFTKATTCSYLVSWAAGTWVWRDGDGALTALQRHLDLLADAEDAVRGELRLCLVQLDVLGHGVAAHTKGRFLMKPCPSSRSSCLPLVGDGVASHLDGDLLALELLHVQYVSSGTCSCRRTRRIGAARQGEGTHGLHGAAPAAPRAVPVVVAPIAAT